MRSINRVTDDTHGFVVYDKRHPFAPKDWVITDRDLFMHDELHNLYQPVYKTRQHAEEVMKQVNKVYGAQRSALYTKS